MMAMPEARGLYHRAIVQSGSSYLQAFDRDAGTKHGRALLAAMGMQPGDAAKLAEMPMDKLVEGMAAAAKLPDKPDFRPIADGSCPDCWIASFVITQILHLGDGAT